MCLGEIAVVNTCYSRWHVAIVDDTLETLGIKGIPKDNWIIRIIIGFDYISFFSISTL